MRDLPQLVTQPGTCLVLSGGATKAFYFHLGVMKVIQGERISSIVGSSAGAVMGAFIASGVEVERLEKALRQKQVFSPKLNAWIRTLTSTMLFKPQYMGLAKQTVATGASGLRFLLSLPGLLNKDILAELIDTFIHSQQRATSFFDASALESLFTTVLPTGSFQETEIDLYVTATGLDSPLRAVFNRKYDFEYHETVFMSDVPIHKAVRASCALPGLFDPVKIKGQYWVDGEIKRTLSADIGLQLADRIIISHTYKPLHLSQGSVRDLGWINILKQSTFLVLRERIEAWRKIYRMEHPDKELIWIEPDDQDLDFFLAQEFTFREEVQRRLIAAGERAAEKALAQAAV